MCRAFCVFLIGGIFGIIGWTYVTRASITTPIDGILLSYYPTKASYIVNNQTYYCTDITDIKYKYITINYKINQSISLFYNENNPSESSFTIDWYYRRGWELIYTFFSFIPLSICVLGCCSGNGLEVPRIHPEPPVVSVPPPAPQPQHAWDRNILFEPGSVSKDEIFEPGSVKIIESSIPSINPQRSEVYSYSNDNDSNEIHLNMLNVNV